MNKDCRDGVVIARPEGPKQSYPYFSLLILIKSLSILIKWQTVQGDKEAHNKMNKKARFIHLLKKNYPYLRDNFKVKRIGLFGSFAKGEQKSHSDIDIVVKFEKADFDNFMNLVFYLEELFGRKVDILTPEGIRSIRVKKVAEDIKRSVRYV